MAPTEELRRDRIDFLLSQVGELKGTTTGIVGQLQTLSLELRRVVDDFDRRQGEQTRLIAEHMADDRKSFDKINRIIYGAAGILAALEFVSRYIFH